MNFARTFRPIALALCTVSLLLTLSGCKAEHLESSGEDDAFIRLPNERPIDIPIGDGPLVPTAPGTQWIYAIQTELRSQDLTQTATPKMGEERVVALGPKTIGKSTGTAFKIYQNGKAFREEILRLDAQGLSLVAAGINNGASVDTMTITPGIPLIEFPIHEGTKASWEGILRLMKNNIQAPGYAYSRVSGRETIELSLKSGAARKVDAYKVETMISTTVNSRPIYLYSARWFAPGMGMIRQLVISGNQVITKQLVQFTPAGNTTRVAATH